MRILVLLLLLMTLGACGQKGPLFLPKDNPPEDTASPS
jgi:predicted small lipoprotein YifL